MQPNDVFERAYVKTVAELEAAMARLSHVAVTDHETARDFWRGRIDPHAANACPFEVILYRAQTFDMTVGPETYEARKIDSLDVFVPILEALSHGRIITRRWSSAVSGAPVRVETLVTLPGDVIWQDHRQIAAFAADAQIERRDCHFVAYERAPVGAAATG